MMNYPTNSPKLFAAAVSQWLLVLPAALLLAAAALRQLQPAQYEPARTISAMLVWILPSISHSGAALLFVGLPAIALMVGCMTLLRSWHRSGTLRQDVGAALASLRRNLAIVLLGTGTLLAGAILAAVLVHIVTD